MTVSAADSPQLTSSARDECAASAELSAQFERKTAPLWSTTAASSRRSLAAVFVAAILLLSLFSLSTLADEPDAGMSLAPRADGSFAVTWVMGGGSAAEAGLRAGDVALLVDVPAGRSGWLAVHVLRGGREGDTLVLSRRWSPALDLALLLLGLEFLAAGVLVFLRASDRSSSLRAAALAGTIAVTLVAFPAIGDGHPWALALEWFGSKAAMAAFVLFFLSVPLPRWRLLRRIFLWAPVPILTAYCLAALSRPDLYPLVKLAGYSYMACGMVVGVVGMVWPLLAPSPRTHRRLWPVAVGSGLAVGIYLFGSLLPFLLFRRYLLPAEVAVLGVGFIPLGFAWAMLRYPVMGISLGPWAVVRTVFDNITDPIFVVGRDGCLLEASRTGLELLGISRVRDAQGPFPRLLAQLDADAPPGSEPSGVVDRVLSAQPVHDAEVALRLPSGATMYVSVAGTPLLDEQGQVAMAVLAFRDITARKAREAAKTELERQKDEFLASVSHDLRTPLAAIKYSLGVVLANEPSGFPEPLHRMLANVDGAADRMASLVDDLLEMARLQAGTAQMQLEPCDLRVIARRSFGAIEPLATAREQQLHLELPARSCVAVIDGRRLERALTNLLVNANKYGKEAGNIWLKLTRRSGQFLFQISDDGQGIPEAEQTRIFERFYRSGSSATSGSGLGLPIARAMVELHGGRLWVESTPGMGATFWVAIPSKPPAQLAV